MAALEFVQDAALLSVNALSTVGIVIVNKLVLTSLPYPLTLTWCHQVVAGTLIMGRKCAFLPKKPMPLPVTLWWSFLAVGSIYSQNLSLRLNTVTLYQIAKLLNIPTQCLWQYFTQSKVLSLHAYGSLVVLTIGVGLTTIAELNFSSSSMGIVVAGLGVLWVVLEQAETQRIKAKYSMDTLDFLHSTSLHRMCMSGTLSLFVERDAFNNAPSMRLEQWGLLLLSCCIATSINITVVAVIGKFGAVTTAVVGHLKTILIVIVGFFMNPHPIDMDLAKDLTGIAIALAGAIKYGQYTSFPEADCFARCGAQKDELLDGVRKDHMSNGRSDNHAHKPSLFRVLLMFIASIFCVFYISMLLLRLRAIDADALRP